MLNLFRVLFIVNFLVISLQAFSAPCEDDGFSVTGVETYKELLIRLAKLNLGVKQLSPRQIEALETYHHIVQGEKGENGTSARVENYTVLQRRKIMRFLLEVFSPEQVTLLIEEGIVEINRIKVIISEKLVLEYLERGKEVIMLYDDRYSTNPRNSTELYRIGKLIKRTNYGLLVEGDKLYADTGHLVTGKVFFTPLEFKSGLSRVLEKTDLGFVIYIKGDMRYDFFSFEKATENGLLPKNPTPQNYRELEDMLNNFLSLGRDNYIRLSNSEVERIEKTVELGRIENALAVKRIEKTAEFDRIENALVEVYVYTENTLLGSPLIGSSFSASKSTQKEISIKDLELPSLTNQEAQLAEQGYRSNYIAGINKINEWTAVRERLQELGVNPWKTHIEYFAEQVPHHIAYIRKGLKDNYTPFESSDSSKSDQLLRLETLEQEAKEVISNKRVTYKWWLEFNFRLALIMSGFSDFKNKMSEVEYINNDYVGELMKNISYFPSRFVVPTIAGSNIGIMAFNRAHFEGIYPAGLINQQSKEVDGREYNAMQFLIHDFGHGNIQGNQPYLMYSAGHRLFFKRLLHNIEQLPMEKRKKAEIVYFLMTHENIGQSISYGNINLQQVREKVVNGIRQDIPRIFRFPDDPSLKEQKIEDLADTFMEVYNQTLQHQ